MRAINACPADTGDHNMDKVQKTLDVDNEEIQWLLAGLNAADHESLLPTVEPGKITLIPKVHELKKKLRRLLSQPRKK